MWANYFNHNIEPIPAVQDDDIITSSINAKITCSGRQQIKVGGSAKTFTVTYYDYNNEELPDYTIGNWLFEIDGTVVPDDLLTLTPLENKIKVKFLGDDSYIGKILTVKNTSENAVAELQIEIIAL